MMLLFWVILAFVYFLGPSTLALAVFHPDLFIKVAGMVAGMIGYIWWQAYEH